MSTPAQPNRSQPRKKEKTDLPRPAVRVLFPFFCWWETGLACAGNRKESALRASVLRLNVFYVGKPLLLL